MEEYRMFRVVVDDEKIKRVFERMDAAKEELRQCVSELGELGVVVIGGKKEE